MNSYFNNKLIADFKLSSQKLYITNKLGGNVQNNYTESKIIPITNSTVIQPIPLTTYLTTTPYPISLNESIVTSNIDVVSGRLDTNLDFEFSDNTYQTSLSFKELSGSLYVALIVYSYLGIHKPEMTSIGLNSIDGDLRNVLKSYGSPDNLSEYSSIRLKVITGSIQSILIQYSDWVTDNTSITLSAITSNNSKDLENSYKSFMSFNAEDSLGNSVTTVSGIHDTSASDRIWTGTNYVISNTVYTEGNSSIYLNGSTSTLDTPYTTDLEISNTNDLIIEGYFKPDSLSSLLISTYGNVNTPDSDTIKDLTGTVPVTATTVIGEDNTYTITGTGSSSGAIVLQTTSLYNLPMSAKGYTVDVCFSMPAISSFKRRILLGNKSPSWSQSTTGKSLGLVYFGTTYPTSSLRGKIAIVSDNTSITGNADGVILITTSIITPGNKYTVTLVGKNNLLYMFINGVLQGSTSLTANLNFSYLGCAIGYAPWDITDNASSTWDLYCARITNIGLYTSNFISPSSYTLFPVPKVPSLTTNSVSLFNCGGYANGYYSELVYNPATLTIPEQTVITAGMATTVGIINVISTPINISKWNHIKVVYNYNNVIIYVNNRAFFSASTKANASPINTTYNSFCLGYSIYNTSKTYSGYIDNFRIYKDNYLVSTDVGTLGSQLTFGMNSSSNGIFNEINPNDKWTNLGGLSVFSTTDSNNVSSNVLDSYFATPGSEGALVLQNPSGLLEGDTFEIGCTTTYQNQYYNSTYMVNLFNSDTTTATQDDAVGISHTWSIVGAVPVNTSYPITPTGTFYTAYFNGSSYLTSSNSVDFNFPTTIGGYSLDIYCTACATSTTQTLFSCLDPSSYGYALGIVGTSSTSFKVWVSFYADGALKTMTTDSTYNINVQYNLKYMIYGYNHRIYINNSLIKNLSSTNTYTPFSYINSTGSFSIGASPTGSTKYKGYIANFKYTINSTPDIATSTYTSGLQLGLGFPFDDAFVIIAAVIQSNYMELVSNALLSSTTWSRIGLRLNRTTNTLSIILNGMVDSTMTNQVFTNNTGVPLTLTYSNYSNYTSDPWYYKGYLDNFYIKSSSFIDSPNTEKSLGTIFDNTINSNLVFNIKASTNEYRNTYDTFFIDSSNYCNPILNAPSVNTRSAKTDRGIEFISNTSASYISYADISEYIFGSNDFYIEFDIKMPTNGTNRMVVIDRYGTTAGLWQISINTDGTVLFMQTTAGSFTFLQGTNAPVNDSQWHKIQYRRTAGSLYLYVDEVLTDVFSISTVFNGSITTFSIGGQVDSRDPTYDFIGSLDNIKIVNGVSGSIDNTMNATKIMSALSFETMNVTSPVTYTYTPKIDHIDSEYNDWTNNMNSGSTTGVVLKTMNAGEAAYFDSNSNLSSYNEHSKIGLSQFTLEFYLKPTVNSITQQIICCVNSSWECGIGADSSIYFGTNFSNSYSTAPNVLLFNANLQHVAITRDSTNTLRIFVNGIKQLEVVSATFFGYSVPVITYPLIVGQEYTEIAIVNSTYNYTGYIKDFYLSRDECKYTTNFTPSITESQRRTPVSLLNFSTSGTDSTYNDMYSSIVWNNTGGNVNNSKILFRPYSMQFNNPSYYMTSTSSNFLLYSNDFTLDLIFCPMQVSVATTLLDLRTGLSNQGILITQATGQTAAITVNIGSNTTSPWDITLTTGVNSLTISSIYHLRICRNLGNIYLFLNGILVDTANYVLDIATSNTCYIANNSAHSQGFNGYIEQFRLIRDCAQSRITFPAITRELI